MDHESSLTSIDTDAAVQAVAQQHLGTRLSLVTGDAVAYLETQPARSFDLIFADALSGKYDGLDVALDRVKVGGLYVIDDMLPQPNWPEGHGKRVEWLMKELATRPDFRIVPMIWASGVVIATRVS